MKFMPNNIFSLFLVTILISSLFVPAYALQSNMLDPNVQVTLDYPDVIQFELTEKSKSLG